MFDPDTSITTQRLAAAMPSMSQADLIDALDGIETATLLVRSGAHIVFANHAAQTLLDRGSPLKSRGDRLLGATATIARQLHGLIERATEQGRGGERAAGVLPIPQGRQFPLSILIEPVRSRRRTTGIASAMVFIQDLNRAVSASEAMRTLFGLTPTEARIAESIGNGHTVTAIASAQRANIETIRKHLKSIFAKSGAHRQAQLVAIVHRSVGCVLRPGLAAQGDPHLGGE
jgi:DNA-binding CsgD family transcriptional regulator